MPDSQAATTNNWDTVSAIQFKAVNEAIANQKSSPADFDGTYDDPLAGKIEIKADFNPWKLSGGSGNLVHMDLPFTNCRVITPAGTTIQAGDGTATIEVNLTYLPQPGETNKKDLKIDAQKAVDSVSVTMTTPSDEKYHVYVQAALKTWLSNNLQDFNHVFAVANLGSQETAKAFKWLKPTKVGYAVEAPSGASVDDYVFGILAMTEGRPGVKLTEQISPNTIPDGCNGGFLITYERFMNEIFLPGAVPIFNGASVDDFTVTADGTQVANNKKLTFADLEIPTNKSGSETRKITDASIAANGFTLTAFDTYLELQFTDLTFTFEEGYIAHLNYTGYQTIGVTETNHLEFTQPKGMPPKLTVTIVETTGEKWKELIESIVIGVVFAVVGAMIGGALGPAAEEAGEGAETAATDAAEDAGEESSMDFSFEGPEDEDIENLDELESDDEAGAADEMDSPSRTQKFKGWFRRNWTKMLGMAIGGAVGVVVTKIPEILRDMAEDDLTKVPTLDEFAEEAVEPAVFANTKSFALKSVQMNGVIQMGLDVSFKD